MPSKAKGILLYIVTLMIELIFTASARFIAYSILTLIPQAALVSLIIFYQTNERIVSIAFFISAVIYIIGLIVAYAPIVFSMITFLGGGSGHTFTRMALGARHPSTREKKKVFSIISQIQKNAGKRTLEGFARIYVIDSQTEYMYLIGNTLYISSLAINSDYLQSRLAHELGHHQQSDGLLILGLRRFVLPLMYIFVSPVRDYSTARPKSVQNPAERPDAPEFNIVIPNLVDDSEAETFFAIINRILFFAMSFAGGGLGVWLMSPFWSAYFRERDYTADQFVSRYKMKDELVSYLETNRFYDTSVPFMRNWQPANEQRIDALLNG